jgi:hypothetical protein
MPVKYYDCFNVERNIKAYQDKEGKQRHKISVKHDCGAINIAQEQEDKRETEEETLSKEEEHKEESGTTIEEIREMFIRFLK